MVAIIGLITFCAANIPARQFVPKKCTHTTGGVTFECVGDLSTGSINSTKGWPYAFQSNESDGLTGDSVEYVDYSNLAIDIGLWIFGIMGVSTIGLFILRKTKSKK